VLSYSRIRLAPALAVVQVLLSAAPLPAAQGASANPGSVPAEAQALARAVQQKYETVRDFKADFVQTYQGGTLGKTVTEHGTVLVRKPGMMRWTYEGADRKVFVSDGRKLYSYLPEERQVYVGDVPSEDRASTAVLFLAGKGNLLRDFTVGAAPAPHGAPRGTLALKLVPKRRDGDYESLVLVVDRDSLAWRMLVAQDTQGGRSTFTFSNLQENVGLTDREFTFKIPRGVDVITDGAPRP
jgi:outer membrane lipoprotein carrier protein